MQHPLPQPAGGVPESGLCDSSEIGAVLRCLDVSATALGPYSAWPAPLRAALDLCLGSPHPLAIYWGPQYLTFYNGAFGALLGATPAAAMGQPASTVWAQVWPTLAPSIERVFRAGQASIAENQGLIVHRNGQDEEACFTLSYSPIRDEKNQVGGVLCIAQETTPQSLAERRLNALRDLSAHTAAAKAVPEVCAAAMDSLTRHLSDLPFALLYLLDEKGRQAQLMHAVGVAPDTALAPSQVRLSLFKGPAQTWPLAAVAQSGQIQRVDDLPARFADLPQDAQGRRPATALLLPLAASSSGRLAGILVVGLSPTRPLDAAGRAFLEVLAGQIAAAISAAQAYQAQAQRAQSLAELDRVKTAFFSNVSHEFRTPLTLILGPLEDELAETANDSAPLRRQRLRLVHRNALRLLKMINSLLDFAKLEAGRIQPLFEPTDLASYTQELASLFRPAIIRAGLKLIVDCPPLSQYVYIDREMWENVVLNLLSNALKFTLSGEITVSLRMAGQQAQLSVCDTGVGIAPDNLPFLFERFYRVRGAGARSHEGTGIGLALVNELVKLHGGSVEVQSQINRGTTFTVSLPLGCDHLPRECVGGSRTAPSAAVSAAGFVEEAMCWVGEGGEDLKPRVTEPLAEAVERGRILLADDNADLRQYLGQILGQHWEVQSVSDGLAALEAIERQAPDLVLADVVMPRLDGVHLLQHLRQDPRTQEVAVILISARLAEEARLEAIQAGADDYLIKPFSTRELLARVNTHMEVARLRRQEVSREKARAEAEAANRAKDHFLAVLSHELRTPLTPVLVTLQCLQAQMDLPPQVRSDLALVRRNVELETRLIDDLLDLTRIARGKLQIQPQCTEVHSVLCAALKVCDDQIRVKRLSISTDFQAEFSQVHADPARLQQVFWNLFKNAIKFTPEGGSIAVRTWNGEGGGERGRIGEAANRRGGEEEAPAADPPIENRKSKIENPHDSAVSTQHPALVIEITDTGIGIEPDAVGRIFDPFEQAPQTLSRRLGGLGLGLSISKGIIELHGGAISAHSDGPGQGATFRIELSALARGMPHPERRDRPPRSAGTNRRILLVEDHKDTRQIMSRLLQKMHYDVITADSVSAALDATESEDFDLIISDLGLPDGNGLELMRQLLERHRLIKSIALSGYGMEEDVDDCKKAGFTEHLTKPVDVALLQATIERLTSG